MEVEVVLPPRRSSGSALAVLKLFIVAMVQIRSNSPFFFLSLLPLSLSLPRCHEFCCFTSFSKARRGGSSSSGKQIQGGLAAAQLQTKPASTPGYQEWHFRARHPIR